MRHVCSKQHQSTSEKLMGIKETLHGVYLLCGKSKSLGNKGPCLDCWQYIALIGQAGHKRKCLPNIVKNSPSEYPASQKSLSAMLGLYAKDEWMLYLCISLHIFGDCLVSQMFLPFLTFFESCLIALPACSVYVISFWSLSGSWRLDSYTYSLPCLWDSEKKFTKEI